MKIFFIAILSVLGNCFSAMSQLPAIDLTKGAFSCRGSYLAFTRYQGREKEPSAELKFNTVTRRPGTMLLFAITALENGEEVPATISADPSKLEIKTNGGSALICFQSADIVRIQLKNINLRLKSPIECRLMPITATRWRYEAEWTERFMISAHKGSLTSKPSTPDKMQNTFTNLSLDITPDNTGVGDFEFEYYLSQANFKPSSPSFEECVQNKEKEFTQWVKSMPSVPAAYQSSLAKAAYVNWSSLVHPRDQIKREGMIMSKLWMNAIWSWDHCFNAMATAYSDPELAFDQMMVVFDQQNEIGAIPDDTYESKLGWGYLKPPIHGWTLKCMMEKSHSITTDMLIQIYPRLVKWTNFYFNYRDDNKNGLAETHHGNDSGADNATVFDEGMPVDDPALNADLIIQMDVLADIADRLRKPKEAKDWKQRADNLYTLLMKNLWDGNHFVFRRVLDGKPNIAPFSFMRAMPLMLANRLPKTIQQNLIGFIRDTLVTPYGIATEAITSPKYPTATYLYWRGAIWPPIMYMLIDAMERCGEKEMSIDLAKKYCDMCKIEGFAENFNPVTGKGLVDPAYTWGSSVFILLAHEYLDKKK